MEKKRKSLKLPRVVKDVVGYLKICVLLKKFALYEIILPLFLIGVCDTETPLTFPNRLLIILMQGLLWEFVFFLFKQPTQRKRVALNTSEDCRPESDLI